jgi:hypothetical protein
MIAAGFMRLFLKFCCFAALLASPVASFQDPTLGHPPPGKEEVDHRLPNGKSQNEEILKVEYQKSVEDAASLVELAQSLQKDLEADGRHVLSLSSLKKTEEIERIAKRIRGRMRRF